MIRTLTSLALLFGLTSLPMQERRCATDNLELGIPCECDQIIDHEGYAVGYSKRYGQALWVAYRLTAEEASSHVVERMGRFTEDPLVLENAAKPADYHKSGYDRGHLAPAADMHWSTNAMVESFYMSNMSPQTPELNRRTWAYAESYVRACAMKEGSVFVVSGPVMTNAHPKWMGDTRIAVPDAFYKVAYDETPPEKMIAFVIPNGKPESDIWLYATNVAYVEEITGLSFFNTLDTNKTDALKRAVNLTDWTSINQ